jgi:hypothetical protein
MTSPSERKFAQPDRNETISRQARRCYFSAMQPMQAQIYRGELEFIGDCVSRYPDIETGGDFFGFWSKTGEPVIQYVLGPGEQTSRSGASFFQDIPYLRQCGAALHESFGLEHIGAWHSHHRLQLYTPSGGDVNTMHNALSGESLTRFLIGICNIEDNVVSMGCFLFDRHNPSDYSTCDIVTLPGTSPIRDKLRELGTASPVRETDERLSVRNGGRVNVPFRLRSGDADGRPAMDRQKPLFPEDSIWAKREGQQYLKAVYDRLRSVAHVSDVEVKQLGDGRPAITFQGFGNNFEIRFPQDFPASVPEVLARRNSEDGRRFRWKRAPKARTIRELISSLDLLNGTDRRKIMIRIE